ncbi:hypothetical protein LT85_2796 [Collimonas arenae]|uniref:Uncharacterized protein n=1 Tax=Collimonas arenae TaxID=279058 RepID=A0A0A1FE68_9BURK|nr:hypothetical protein [Collimonas arenae]AIY41954.1 hypothetical protein LT85_2796 [Collimonas arenae]
MNDDLLPIIAIGVIVIFGAIVLVKKGYVKQAEKTHLPVVLMSFCIIIVCSLIAFSGN